MNTVIADNNKKRLKGQGNVRFVLGLVVFIAFFGYLISQIAFTHPEANVFGAIDLTLLAAAFGTTAVACTVAGGIGCILSAGVFALLPAMFTENPVLFSLLILPLNIAFGYLLSRLIRGGG